MAERASCGTVNTSVDVPMQDDGAPGQRNRKRG